MRSRRAHDSATTWRVHGKQGLCQDGQGFFLGIIRFDDESITIINSHNLQTTCKAEKFSK